MGSGRLLQPADNSAKGFYFALAATEPSNPAVGSARQNLGQAYLRKLRDALAHDDIAAAEGWLQEARLISHSGADFNAATTEITAARELAEQRASVVGANSLARVKYVAPKFPSNNRNRSMNGWVEMEFTVLADGTTANITVTNSNPRKTFDAAAVNAVEQWRYEPVKRRGKVVEQRAAVRIRFSEE
jgi:TonB family protein